MRYKKVENYKIIITVSDKVYSGATCSPLSKRMVAHRQNAKKGSDPLFTDMQDTGPDSFYIELVRSSPAQTKSN